MQLATKGSTGSYIKMLAIATYRGIAIHLKLAILYKIVHLLASSFSRIAAHEFQSECLWIYSVTFQLNEAF